MTGKTAVQALQDIRDRVTALRANHPEMTDIIDAAVHAEDFQPLDVKAFRVRFEFDNDAQFEECNGEARPLTEAEYAENGYRGCPNHPRSKVAPQRTENGRAWCGECGTEYADIPYAEYLAYYSNPERHVFFTCIVEGACSCCGKWSVLASLVNIDIMDNDPALRTLYTGQNYTPAEALALPGYFGDVAKDELTEAGYVIA